MPSASRRARTSSAGHAIEQPLERRLQARIRTGAGGMPQQHFDGAIEMLARGDQPPAIEIRAADFEFGFGTRDQPIEMASIDRAPVVLRRLECRDDRESDRRRRGAGGGDRDRRDLPAQPASTAGRHTSAPYARPRILHQAGSIGPRVAGVDRPSSPGPACHDEHAMRISEVARRRRDDRAVADHDLARQAHRLADIFLAHKIHDRLTSFAAADRRRRRRADRPSSDSTCRAIAPASTPGPARRCRRARQIRCGRRTYADLDADGGGRTFARPGAVRRPRA